MSRAGDANKRKRPAYDSPEYADWWKRRQERYQRVITETPYVTRVTNNGNVVARQAAQVTPQQAQHKDWTLQVPDAYRPPVMYGTPTKGEARDYSNLVNAGASAFIGKSPVLRQGFLGEKPKEAIRNVRDAAQAEERAKILDTIKALRDAGDLKTADAIAATQEPPSEYAGLNPVEAVFKFGKENIFDNVFGDDSPADHLVPDEGTVGGTVAAIMAAPFGVAGAVIGGALHALDWVDEYVLSRPASTLFQTFDPYNPYYEDGFQFDDIRQMWNKSENITYDEAVARGIPLTLKQRKFAAENPDALFQYGISPGQSSFWTGKNMLSAVMDWRLGDQGGGTSSIGGLISWGFTDAEKVEAAEAIRSGGSINVGPVGFGPSDGPMSIMQTILDPNTNIYDPKTQEELRNSQLWNLGTGVQDAAFQLLVGGKGVNAVGKAMKRGLGLSGAINNARTVNGFARSLSHHIEWKESGGTRGKRTFAGVLLEGLVSAKNVAAVKANPLFGARVWGQAPSPLTNKVAKIVASTTDVRLISDIVLARRGHLPSIARLLSTDSDIFDEMSGLSTKMRIEEALGRTLTPADESYLKAAADTAFGRDRFAQIMRDEFLNEVDDTLRVNVIDTSMPMGVSTLRSGAVRGAGLSAAAGHAQHAMSYFKEAARMGWESMEFGVPGSLSQRVVLKAPGYWFSRSAQWAFGKRAMGYVQLGDNVRANDLTDELIAHTRGARHLRGNRQFTYTNEAGETITTGAAQWRGTILERLAEVDGNVPEMGRVVAEIEREIVSSYVHKYASANKLTEEQVLKVTDSIMAGKNKSIASAISNGGYWDSVKGTVEIDNRFLSQIRDGQGMLLGPLDQIDRALAKEARDGFHRVRSGIALGDRVLGDISMVWRMSVLFKPSYIWKNSLAEPWVASVLSHGALVTPDGTIMTLGRTLGRIATGHPIKAAKYFGEQYRQGNAFRFTRNAGRTLAAAAYRLGDTADIMGRAGRAAGLSVRRNNPDLNETAVRQVMDFIEGLGTPQKFSEEQIAEFAAKVAESGLPPARVARIENLIDHRTMLRQEYAELSGIVKRMKAGEYSPAERAMWEDDILIQQRDIEERLKNVEGDLDSLHDGWALWDDSTPSVHEIDVWLEDVSSVLQNPKAARAWINENIDIDPEDPDRVLRWTGDAWEEVDNPSLMDMGEFKAVLRYLRGIVNITEGRDASTGRFNLGTKEQIDARQERLFDIFGRPLTLAEAEEQGLELTAAQRKVLGQYRAAQEITETQVQAGLYELSTGFRIEKGAGKKWLLVNKRGKTVGEFSSKKAAFESHVADMQADVAGKYADELIIHGGKMQEMIDEAYRHAGEVDGVAGAQLNTLYGMLREVGVDMRSTVRDLDITPDMVRFVKRRERRTRMTTRLRSGMGQQEVVAESGRYTTPGLFSVETDGTNFAKSMSADEAVSRSYDMGQYQSSRTSRWMQTHQPQEVRPDDPMYYTELAWIANRQFRNDPLARKILEKSDYDKVGAPVSGGLPNFTSSVHDQAAEVFEWLRKDPEGMQYAADMGWDIKDAKKIAEMSRKAVEQVNRYLPSPALRRTLLERPLKEGEIAEALESGNYPVGSITGRSWQYYTDNRGMKALMKTQDAIFRVIAAMPENYLFRMPWGQREMNRAMAKRINIISGQGGAALDDAALKGLRAAAARDVVVGIDNTFYNIRRYSNPVYAMRYIGAFPGAYFNSMYRMARMTYQNPGNAMVMSWAWQNVMYGAPDMSLTQDIYGTDEDSLIVAARVPVKDKNGNTKTDSQGNVIYRRIKDPMDAAERKDAVVVFHFDQLPEKLPQGWLLQRVLEPASLFGAQRDMTSNDYMFNVGTFDVGVQNAGFGYAITVPLNSYVMANPIDESDARKMMGDAAFDAAFPFGMPSNADEFTMGLPVGDVEIATGPFVPNYMQSAITMLGGGNQSRFNSMAVNIHAYRMWEWRSEGGQGEPPSAEAAADEARKYLLWTVARKWAAPTGMSGSRELGALERDQWNAILKRNKYDEKKALAEFLPLYGGIFQDPEMTKKELWDPKNNQVNTPGYVFTVGNKERVGGIVMSSNAQTVDLVQEHEGLLREVVAAHPDDPRQAAIMFAGIANDPEFNATVYDWLQHYKLPGTRDEAVRVLTPAEWEAKLQEQRSWARFDRLSARRNAILAKNEWSGLERTGEAGKYNDEWQKERDDFLNRKENRSMRDTYYALDAARATRAVEAMRKVLKDDKFMSSDFAKNNFWTAAAVYSKELASAKKAYDQVKYSSHTMTATQEAALKDKILSHFSFVMRQKVFPLDGKFSAWYDRQIGAKDIDPNNPWNE